MEPGEYLDCGIKWMSSINQIVWFVEVECERVNTVLNQTGIYKEFDTSPLSLLHSLSYRLGYTDDKIKFIEFNDGDL